MAREPIPKKEDVPAWTERQEAIRTNYKPESTRTKAAKIFKRELKNWNSKSLDVAERRLDDVRQIDSRSNRRLKELFD